MRLRYAFRRRIDTHSIIKYVNPCVRAGTLAVVDGRSHCVSPLLWIYKRMLVRVGVSVNVSVS